MEKIENVKRSLQSINDRVNEKNDPLVNSLILAPIKVIPVIGDLISSSTDKLLSDFQKKKEQELIDVILNGQTSITTEMVNDVEFIINYVRVVESVRRLATNDKVVFFGNLIRNGYLSNTHIENCEFEEWLDILNTMSYREIKYLIQYKNYCEENGMDRKKNVYFNCWYKFKRECAQENEISINELYLSFIRIKHTGFLEEEYETDSGNVDEDDYSFHSLSIDSTGFRLTKRFLKFYNMVLSTNK